MKCLVKSQPNKTLNGMVFRRHLAMPLKEEYFIKKIEKISELQSFV